MFTISCSYQNVTKNHGVSGLEKKYSKITINNSNRNDILKELGPPSVVSTFDENLWIYIERVKENQSIVKLGKEKIKKNNVLIVQLNDVGLLEKKEIFNVDNMNELEFSKKISYKNFSDENFLTGILTSLKQKINSPTKNRKK